MIVIQGDFFGIGMMVEVLKHLGTTAWLSEVFKMSLKTSFSCSAHSFGLCVHHILYAVSSGCKVYILVKLWQHRFKVFAIKFP